MIFQYGLEPVLLQRILIGLEAIVWKSFPTFVSLFKELSSYMLGIQRMEWHIMKTKNNKKLLIFSSIQPIEIQ